MAESMASEEAMTDSAEGVDMGRKQGAEESATIVVRLKKWSSDATVSDIYQIYLDEQPEWLNSSAFYLDAAQAMFDLNLEPLGLRILSSLAEMNLENRHLLRILGYRLMELGQAETASHVFKEVRRLAPGEPQSGRDLGLAYEASGQLQLAVDTLYETVEQPWDARFPEVELILLGDLNALIANAPAHSLDTSAIDPRLLKNMILDLRVVLTWDADNTDIDLWVIDPNGEKCFYKNHQSYQGGSLSRDFTGGYGPEEFSLKDAKPGKYLVQANFYGQRQQLVAQQTTLQLQLFSFFCTDKQEQQSITLRLKGVKEVVTVAEFSVKE